MLSHYGSQNSLSKPNESCSDRPYLHFTCLGTEDIHSDWGTAAGVLVADSSHAEGVLHRKAQLRIAGTAGREAGIAEVAGQEAGIEDIHPNWGTAAGVLAADSFHAEEVLLRKAQLRIADTAGREAGIAAGMAAVRVPSTVVAGPKVGTAESGIQPVAVAAEDTLELV
jgi:hypothetical protein